MVGEGSDTQGGVGCGALVLVDFGDVIFETLFVDAADFGLDIAFFTVKKVMFLEGVWWKGIAPDGFVLVGDMC